jgi:hypothetical protein
MVLMLKGVGKKWKKPMAYYFTANGTKSPMVAKHIKTVIREVQAIGLSCPNSMRPIQQVRDKYACRRISG